jgi:ribosomal protein L5
VRNPEVSKYYRVFRSVTNPRSDRFRTRGMNVQVHTEDANSVRARRRQAVRQYPRRAKP